MARKCFCDIHPICYEISKYEEIAKRFLKDVFSTTRFAKRGEEERLPVVGGGERIPLAADTAVGYNYIDYRFKNETDQDFQIFLWCEGEDLCAELRAARPLTHTYGLVEEDHHFRKEGDKYYRCSKLYRTVSDNGTGKLLEKTLIWDNHSEVVFDPKLIPQALLRV